VTVNSIGLYYNRNRWYSPALGRFTSCDPNETALPVVTALLMNGEAWSILADGFSAAGHFGDGMNLYQYLGSNPLAASDPLGLSDWDWFEEVDDTIVGMAGEKAAAAHHAFAMIRNTAQRAAIMALQGTIAALFPPYGLYLSLEGAAFAMEDMLFNGPSWNSAGMFALSAMGARASYGASMDQLERMGAGIRRAYNRVGRRYAEMGAAKSGFSGEGPTTVRAVGRGVCFPAGTLVAAADGTFVPIETLQLGDRVLSVEVTSEGWLRSDGDEEGVVMRTVARDTDAIVTVHLTDGRSVRSTPGHPFWVPGEGWTAAANLKRGSGLSSPSGTAVTVARVDLSRERVRVYNLDIEPHHTFLVTPDSLLVHNGCVMPWIRGTRPASGDATYIYNVVTGEFIVDSACRPHMIIWAENAGGAPLGEFVGGFAKFKNGKFVSADMSSYTFSGTAAMQADARDAFRLLVGK